MRLSQALCASLIILAASGFAALAQTAVPSALPVVSDQAGASLPAPAEAAPTAALPAVATDVDKKIGDIASHKQHISPPGLTPADLSSLLFTPWQQALMEEARRGAAILQRETGSNPAKRNEVLGLSDPNARPVRPKTPGIREISLGGIVYESEKKWTIWLNGARVTPKTLPKQVTSLKVMQDHIEMIWNDPFTERNYPIRLRPQQIFNLDSKRFRDGPAKK